MQTRLYINGTWQTAAGKKTFPSHDPATEDVLGRVAQGGPKDVQKAVGAAKKAFDTWRWLSPIERAGMLHEVANKARAHFDELVELLTREEGKPRPENAEEVGWSANTFSFYAEMGRMQKGRVIPSGERSQLNMVIQEPFGVVGCIVPWNYPLLLLAWKMAPALAAGNTVVIKPSEMTPLITLRFIELCCDHLPPGVVNAVPGFGDAGQALVEHPDVPMIGAPYRQKVADHVKDAKARGAKILTGGRIPRQKGYFYEPTVLVNVDHAMNIMREETFGPAIPMMAYKSFDEAIRLANDSAYGLGATLRSSDPKLVKRFYEEVKAGTIWVNDPLTDNHAGPFGGMKLTGGSRELGEEGFLTFMETKHVHWDFSDEPKTWWLPYHRR